MRGSRARVACFALSVGFLSTGASAQTPSVLVDPEPIAVLGAGVGEEFGFVLAAARFSDGRTLVLDQMSQDIRVFARDGAYLGTWGRKGQGPLEFLGLLDVVIHRDTAFVIDPGNRRISVLSDQGSLLREIPLAVPFVVGEARRTGGGAWVLRRQDRFTFGGPEGMRRDTVDYFIVPEDMSEPRPLRSVPGALAVRWTSDRGTFDRTAPFTPRPKAAAWGDCVYLTSTDRPEIVVHDATGAFVGAFEFGLTPRTTTEGEKRTLVEMMVARLPAGPERERAFAQAMRNLPFPPRLPVTQSMYVDPEGYVWLQSFEPTFRGRSYRLLGPGLEDLGTVHLPVEFRLLGVGSDWVMGLVYGPHEEQTVQIHRLRRSERSAHAGACPEG